MPDRSLKEMIDAYAAGSLPREEFWRAMASRHLGLRDYHPLLKAGVIKQIEIDETELRVVTRDGVRMAWAPEDIRSAPTIAVNHLEYEPVESPFLMHAASRATIVLDIGANAGWYSNHFAHKARQQCRHMAIHAFEPVPSTYAFLSRNVQLNDLSAAVRTNPFGLADAVKDLTIYLPDFSGSGAASVRNLHPDEKTKEVQCHFETLDGYAAEQGLRNIDLIKVDVEGAELMVLQGGMQTILRDKPILFMELLRKWAAPFGYHPNDVFKLMTDAGYAVHAIGQKNGKTVLTPICEMTDQTEETNFAFLIPGEHDWAISIP